MNPLAGPTVSCRAEEHPPGPQHPGPLIAPGPTSRSSPNTAQQGAQVGGGGHTQVGRAMRMGLREAPAPAGDASPP